MSATGRRSPRTSAAHPPVDSVVAIDPVKGDPQRVRIMVLAPDRARARCACTLHREQVAALRIRVGIRWSASVSAKVDAIGEAHAAREDALRAIATSRRPLLATAVANRLRARGHAPRAVTAAIRQLRSDGWISDRITPT